MLELVDGETLADRIARGPLTIGEAVRIARQIAQALAAAHAKRIVHRDLKPANVKITSAGSVKVLDFGLAKAVAESPGAAALTTREGMVMAPPVHMSPEQARAEAVDQQTDIWAFGCVLCETAAPAATPDAVRTRLARCLENDRARRLHSIADAQVDLEGALDSPRPASTFMPPARPHLAWQVTSTASQPRCRRRSPRTASTSTCRMARGHRRLREHP